MVSVTIVLPVPGSVDLTFNLSASFMLLLFLVASDLASSSGCPCHSSTEAEPVAPGDGKAGMTPFCLLLFSMRLLHLYACSFHRDPDGEEAEEVLASLVGPFHR